MCTAKGFGLKSDEVCDRKAPEIAALQTIYGNEIKYATEGV